MLVIDGNSTDSVEKLLSENNYYCKANLGQKSSCKPIAGLVN